MNLGCVLLWGTTIAHFSGTRIPHGRRGKPGPYGPPSSIVDRHEKSFIFNNFTRGKEQGSPFARAAGHSTKPAIVLSVRAGRTGAFHARRLRLLVGNPPSASVVFSRYSSTRCEKIRH